MTPQPAIPMPSAAEPDTRCPLLRSRPLSLAVKLLLLLLILLFTTALQAQTASPIPTQSPGPLPITLNIGTDSLGKPQDVDVAVRILFAITLLTLAPSIILLMTCFMRIAIVRSFVRTALSLRSAPSSQIVTGLSLFLTFFIMAPTWERIDSEAIAPYRAQSISGAEALNRASAPIRAFMLRQTRPKDVKLFVALAKLGPTSPEQLPIEDLILTHLDEEPRWGKIWNIVLGTNYPVRYLSAAQNVPGDFYHAAAERILARQFHG